MEIVRLELLTLDETELLNRAEEAREKAYAPYSHFYVGAAVLSYDGQIFSGANIENQHLGLTMCAERVALANAYASGAKNIIKIGIISRGENIQTFKPTMPCGACRQVIYEASEVSGKDIMIVSANTKRDRILVSSAYELLPFPFGPRDIGLDLSKYR